MQFLLFMYLANMIWTPLDEIQPYIHTHNIVSKSTYLLTFV